MARRFAIKRGIGNAAINAQAMQQQPVLIDSARIIMTWVAMSVVRLALMLVPKKVNASVLNQNTAMYMEE
ncbi:MAG: hypothetical protein MSIBF_01510 [Candidatus Altiarchaeales archaeon IMC4]|nr:MAG: hypothetical protein MSIBF_01510 [Candidatus Altiarchaeales archaeon IMC4]